MSRLLVAVTGARGFIGRNLTEYLTERNISVRGISREGTFGVGNIGPNTDWRQAIEGVDAIVHTAGYAHVFGRAAKDSSGTFYTVNTGGTAQLARQAAEVGVKRLIFLSTIGVNGEESVMPFTETDTPSPRGDYAASKLGAEIELRRVSESTELESVIIRPPLVYGPGAPGNFGRLVSALERGIPLPLGAITRNRRTLVSVENLSDLILRCLTHRSAKNELFLAGDEESLSTADLVRRLNAALGTRTPILPVPIRILSLCAKVAGRQEMLAKLSSSLEVDISKARRMLDWSPPFSLELSVEKMRL